MFLYTDKDKIVRVFNNILKNAIQSIPAGKNGDIYVAIKKSLNSEVFIEIADNGKGIPDEIKDKLFSPNFTTKSTGSGLGLAICKKIIENISGEIWFESIENKGTTFYIRIPSVKIEKK
jgi:signal transduction histidine kinase